MAERIVFLEEVQAGSVRVIATGEVNCDLLDGLEGYIRRQRKILDAALPTAEDVRGIFLSEQSK